MSNLGRPPKAKKHFGQHYLKDQKVIRSICQNHQTHAGSVLEVGPGPGVLTAHLVKLERPMAVVEIDQRFTEILHGLLPPSSVHMRDALEVSWNEFIIQENLPSPVWLVSNLPYNVGTPLMIQFIQNSKIQFMTLMMQKEVGQKILFKNESKKIAGPYMNSLGALVQTYFEVKKLLDVPRGAFNPPPKVESIVLSFERKNHPVLGLEEFARFEAFLRELFKYKRKQIFNVLSTFVSSNIALTEVLTELGLCKNDRAHTLTLPQIHSLYKKLSY